MKHKNKNDSENIDALFGHYKASARKLRTVIMLLLIQIPITLWVVGLENWIAILPQLLELVMVLEKMEEIDN